MMRLAGYQTQLHLDESAPLSKMLFQIVTSQKPTGAISEKEK